MTVWTQDAVNTVAAMLENGATASQIGAALDVTRNAVIGKVARDKRLRAIGFSKSPGFKPGNTIRAPHQTPGAPSPTAGMPRKSRKAVDNRRTSPRITGMVVPKVTTIRPVPTLAPDLEFRCEPVPMMKMTGCKWPVEGAGADALFCNEPRLILKPYCPHHHERAWRPAR